MEVEGQLLVISQFTLCADTRKGRRPAFTSAAEPELANTLFDQFIEMLRQSGVKKVETGVFGANMMVNISNDGPVTIILEI